MVLGDTAFDVTPLASAAFRKFDAPHRVAVLDLGGSNVAFDTARLAAELRDWEDGSCDGYFAFTALGSGAVWPLSADAAWVLANVIAMDRAHDRQCYLYPNSTVCR